MTHEVSDMATERVGTQRTEREPKPSGRKQLFRYLNPKEMI